ncbi:MAG: J domain-containing protein [Thermaurantimonas sp.]
MIRKKVNFVKKKLTSNHKYYQILGLPPGASREQVKRAYRKLAKKYHPDVTSAPEDLIKFRQIKNAYEILTGRSTYSRIPVRFRTYPGTQNSKSFESAKNLDAFRRKYGMTKEEWIQRKAASERIRQKYSEESFKALKSGLFWAVIFTIIVNTFYPMSKKYFNNYMAHKNQEKSIATISYVVGNDVGFVFRTADRIVRTEIRCSFFNNISYLPNGFPALKHDMYHVLYNRNNPKYFKIDFENLHETTKRAYMTRCVEKIRVNPGPFVDIPHENIPLFIQKVYDTFGLEGLTIVYHHSTRFHKNIRYNSLVYFFFKRNKLYKEIFESFLT